jgi:hypothetical protein
MGWPPSDWQFAVRRGKSKRAWRIKNTTTGSKASAEDGGKESRAKQDYGFMRAFEDLDGHIWEIIWIGPTHVPK